MRYRWKKTGEDGYDEQWRLYLILDEVKYAFSEISWYAHANEWGVFVSGYVIEKKAHVEKPYELLCDAKKDVLDYAKVWWVSGEFHRMNDREKQLWHEEGL